MIKQKFIFVSLFLLIGLWVKGQILLKGVVSDSGEPLIGVTILEKDTNNGTTTDIDGSYAITVQPDAILVFSYIGMESKEIAVDNRSEINVEMAEAAEFLDEIIVVGYGNQKRSNISGSVSTVTAEEITKTPVLRVEQALQGRTAGVQITQVSGSPGAELSVKIRGTGTITNTDPLYVVDGIIVEGLDFLNPNDIENISVLKDAASAAVYGARAANGVVLITTKTGTKTREGKVSFESYYGMQTVAKKLDLLNAREYAVILNESYINAGRVPFINTSDPSIFNVGTDWQDAIFENAPIMSQQLSITGGGEKFHTGLSGSFFQQDGIIGGQKGRFDRITLRSVLGYDIKPWLSVGTNIGFTNLHRNALPENSEFVSPVIQALNMDPLTPIYKPDGTYAYSDFVDTDIRNPANAIENTYDTWTTNRVVGTAYAEVKILKSLKFKSTINVDATFANKNVFNPRFNLSVDSTDAPTPEIALINSVSIEDNVWKSWQWDNIGSYSKIFGEHKLDIVGGVSAYYRNHVKSGGANTNLPSNSIDNAFISNTIDPIASQSVFYETEESAFFSYISRVNYEWKDRYLAMVSFRADGSSKFGKNKRFGFFPAVSLGWVASREDFWNIDAISFFKIRASWGQNGNDRIGDYKFTSVVESGQNYTFGEDEIITNGAIALTVANPDLQWETVTQTDIGIDLELFDGRINFIGDYYIKNTTDMLYSAAIPGVVGALPPVQNIGEVENRGLELALQYRNKWKGLNYEIGGNIAFQKNEVLFLGGGDPTFSGQTFVSGAVAKTDIGQPIASFFGYVTDGLFQTQAEVEAHAFQNENTSAGDIRFVDINNDGVINNDDKTYIGNPTPDKIYGFTGSLDYKNFDLSTFFQGVSGNKIFNASVRYDKIGGNRPSSILNRWTGEGTSTTEPKVSLTDPNQNARVSDRFIEDGSFLRMKNIQLGYTLPKALLERMKFDKLRVYVSAQNLLTWTKYSGFDPEIGATGSDETTGTNDLDIGIDRGFYPASRTFLGGIQLVF